MSDSGNTPSPSGEHDPSTGSGQTPGGYGPPGSYNPGAGNYPPPAPGAFPPAAGQSNQPYGQQPGTPYGQQPGTPYGQPPASGPAPYGTPPGAQQPAYGQPTYAAAGADHPKSGQLLGLSIFGLLCCAPVSIYVLITSNQVLRAPGGFNVSKINTAKVISIVSLVLWVLGMISSLVYYTAP